MPHTLHSIGNQVEHKIERSEDNAAGLRDQRSHSHDNEHRADDDTLHATTKDGVSDDGEGFIGDHVREE